jgi:hypothetical protein
MALAMKVPSVPIEEALEFSAILIAGDGPDIAVTGTSSASTGAFSSTAWSDSCTVCRSHLLGFLLEELLMLAVWGGNIGHLTNPPLRNAAPAGWS